MEFRIDLPRYRFLILQVPVKDGSLDSIKDIIFCVGALVVQHDTNVRDELLLLLFRQIESRRVVLM